MAARFAPEGNSIGGEDAALLEPPAEAEGSGHRGLLPFYLQNGVSPGGDLFVMGNQSIERAGEHAAIHVGLGTSDGPLVRRAVVVLPPGAGTAERERLERGYRNAEAELNPAPTGDAQPMSPRVAIKQAATLDAQDLLAMVRQIGRAGTTFIVPLAARYRSPLPLPDEMEAPEDVWVPQLVHMAELLVAEARERESYIALDAGEWWPERERHHQLLVGIEHCGVANASRGGMTPLRMMTMSKRWQALASEGRLAEALAELDAEEELEADRKLYERVLLFRTAGNDHAAASLLDAHPQLIDAAPAGIRLAFADVARSVGREALAGKLLKDAAGAVTAGHTQIELLHQALTLADALEDEATAALIEAALREGFPRSRLLAERHARRLLNDNRREEAAQALDGTGDADDAHDAAYQRWLVAALAPEPGSLAQVLADGRVRWPDRTAETLRAVTGAMERGGAREDALHLLLAGPSEDGELDQGTLWSALEMLERDLLATDGAADLEMVAAVTGATIRWLSRHPTDGWTRMRLVRLLSPELLGGALGGTAVIAKVALDYAERELAIRPSLPMEERASACEPTLLPPLIEDAMRRFSSEPAIVLGRMRFPTEALPAPADEVVTGLLRMIEHAGTHLSDQSDAQLIETCLVVGTAIAPLGREPDADMLLLRTAAGRFAVTGRGQRARDLAEQALSVAGTDPHRVRVAWYTFGDIYARGGNAVEALIGLAAAFAADDAVDWDQVWYESHLALRLLREVGLFSLMGPMLASARKALAQIGVEDRRGYWLDAIELQVDLAKLDRDQLDPVALGELIARASRHLEQVLATNEDAAPGTLVLASLTRIARDAGIAVSADAEAGVARGTERIGAAAAELVALSTGAAPDLAHLVAVARRIETARNAQDIGFDLRHLVLGAGRLLRSGTDADPSVAAYAIEAMADHALGLPHGDDPPRRILGDGGGPLAAARAIARQDLDVVLLGLSDKVLTRVEISEQGATVIREPKDVFSADALAAWGRTYPYAYQDPKRDTSHDFFTSTAQLGLSSLGPRAVIVASTDLQGFPPNLFQVDRELAGVSRRLALAPSLEWLSAAHAAEAPGDHRLTAWIPHDGLADDYSILAVVADRLSDTFERHGVELMNGDTPPRAMSGADLAIIAAHGGVGADKKFFRVIADDAELALAASDFSGSLANVNVVVLFVCSGGRLDKHPAVSATIGLAKQLLDRGCRAVVAPPWPLDTAIPPLWLPAFLDHWTAGAAVIDACFEANQAVRKARGSRPVDDLAMAVYGDALVSAASRES